MIRKTLLAVALVVSSASVQAQSVVDGNWLFSMASPFGVVNADVVWPIENGTVAGTRISFSVNRDGANMTYLMSADIDSDSVVGSASAMGSTSDWTLTRAQ